MDIKQVAVINMDTYGRMVTIAGNRVNIHRLADESGGVSYDDFEDDEAYDRAVEKFEAEYLRKNGVTHVVDPESFGDEKPRPLEAYLNQ